MVVKAVISDLGNVLIKNHPERAARRFCRFNKLSAEENLETRAENVDYMKGTINPSEFARSHIKKYGLALSEEEFHEVYVDIFDLNTQVYRIMRKLRRQVSLVMLSNTELVTTDFLKKKFPQLFELFGNRLALSYELGVIKPAPEIYRAALTMGSAQAEEAVFIDDKKEYVDAACRLGIRGLQYNGVTKLKADLRSFCLRV